LVALLLTASAGAAQGGPDDYAAGGIVHPDHDLPAVRLLVPDWFYEVTASGDLSDLEVFDANGERVPFALVQVDPTTGSYSDWHDMPVFTTPEPLLTDAVGSSGLAVQRAADGSISAIARRSVTGAGIPIQLEPRAVLVDATDYAGRLDDLRLDWMDTFDDFATALRIEASDDLVNWSLITEDAIIASLHVDDLHIRQQQVALPSLQVRFLRITPIDSTATTRIRRVQGRARPPRAEHRTVRQVDGEFVTYARASGVEFDTGGRFPVDQVGLELTEPNHAVYARVLSRTRATQEWRLRGSHVFYRIDEGEVVTRSAPLAIDRTPDRFWQIELSANSDNGHVLQAPPQLEISWLPHQLTWVRSGPAPYTVAIGRGGMDGRSRAQALDRIQELLEPDVDLAHVPLSRIAERVELGGDAAAAPPGRAPWMPYAIGTGVLLVFLVLFALMRRRAT
jgi:hypothetical protein